MTFLNFRADRRCLAPDDGGAGGSGSDTVAGSGADTVAGGGTGAAKWFEDAASFTDDHRAFLTTKGLAVESQTEAVQKLIEIGRNADKRFGKPLDSVIDKPAEGQSLAEWRKANAAIFGIPPDAAGYKIERPAELDKSITWNEAAEVSLRKVAHDQGWTQDDVAVATRLHASVIQDMARAAEAQAAEANAALLAETSAQWGKDAEARITRARQAASVLGEKAGLDADGLANITGLIAAKTGDAATIRLFDVIGQMLADDKLIGAGGAGGDMTADQAKSRLEQMRAPGGAFYEADTAAKRLALQPEIERLTKLAAGSR